MTDSAQIPTEVPAPRADGLPVVVVGAGPIGLAAAAHLKARGLTPLVLEAGSEVGAAMREWGHIATFTPWRYIVDATAGALLASTGWVSPPADVPPTGAELVADYLVPLAEALGAAVVRTNSTVVAVTRDGLDKSRTPGRADRPFLVRFLDASGAVHDVRARAVIDASGTWRQPNPLGGSGLPAHGEAAAQAAGFLVGALPDVLGRDRARFAGRRTLVVGLGHSAANTLLNLARLAREEPGTSVVWAIRAGAPTRVFGGGDADELAARGKLGNDLQALVRSGLIELVAGFSTTAVEIGPDGQTVTVLGETSDGTASIGGVHNIAAATGFRPDLAMLSETRLDLHQGLEAPRTLAPLIDPQFHSCGTVPPHGHRDLAHPEEPGLFLVGMKSYGRAPTFLITTGNEQVRSIAAALSGDMVAADRVELVLPETGVCSATRPDAEDVGGGCCGTSDAATPAPDAAHGLLPVGIAPQGFPTGVAGGGRVDLGLTERTAPGGPCC